MLDEWHQHLTVEFSPLPMEADTTRAYFGLSGYALLV